VWSKELTAHVRVRRRGARRFARFARRRSYAFNGAIAACSRAGEWQQAMKLLNQMGATGVPPDRVSFNSALHGARVGAQATLALQLLTRMSDRDLPPDATAYELAVGACRRGAQPSSALKLVAAAADDGVDATEQMLADALGACASRRGFDASADRLWAQLVALRDGSGGGGSGDEQQGALSVRTYNMRLLERGTVRDWESALALLDEMGRRGTSADVSSWTLAARACGRSGGRSGAWQAALRLLERAPSELGEEGAAQADERMRRSAMQACGRAGEWQRALELLDSAPTKRGAALYGAAMGALSASDGQWRACMSLLSRMRDEGVDGDAGVYGAALHACQKAGEWQQVYDLLYEMRALGVTTAETMQPFHKTLWKRAKRELAA
jgi:pentatricopeptide repeat protein